MHKRFFSEQTRYRRRRKAQRRREQREAAHAAHPLRTSLPFLCLSGVVLAGAIARQVQKLYAAKLVLQQGMGEEKLMGLFAMRSSYPAKLLLRAAQKRSLPWLRRPFSRLFTWDAVPLEYRR